MKATVLKAVTAKALALAAKDEINTEKEKTQGAIGTLSQLRSSMYTESVQAWSSGNNHPNASEYQP